MHEAVDRHRVCSAGYSKGMHTALLAFLSRVLVLDGSLAVKKRALVNSNVSAAVAVDIVLDWTQG